MGSRIENGATEGGGELTEKGPMKTPSQIKKRGASEGQEETFDSKHGGQHASSCTCTSHPVRLKPTTRSYVDHRICRLAEFGSATLQSPRRWLPRAVGHRTRIDGRAYWHRVSQARTSNLILATEAEAVCPSARWLHKSEPDILFGSTSFQFGGNHARGGINRTI
ncbi:MAG: hypothetical protein K0S94_2193 [Nitrospira sp.]|nr:hypothetical protein [Nitrospira sp.]